MKTLCLRSTLLPTSIPISPPIPLLRRRFCSKIPNISATAMDSSPSTSKSPENTIIVCGAGVIGTCTAYFLAKKGARVTLIEKCEPACAASGKAGGFLALDWTDGGPLSALSRHSFLLHNHLATELDGPTNYGYRPLHTLSLTLNETLNPESPNPKLSNLPSWVDGGAATRAAVIGTTQTTAQVHPGLFTRTVLSAAVEKYGVSVVKGEVNEVVFGEGKEVRGVRVEGGDVVEGDGVVLALGPWSGGNRVVKEVCGISGLKAHSIVLRPREAGVIGAEALFLNFRTAEGKSIEPEVYPRPTGEVYICGMSEEVDVPDDPLQILPREDSIKMLQRVAKTVSSHLGSAEVTAEQACFLPCSEDGKPVIGKIPEMDGVYVATGHSCWGILNAPATGASLAELIIDGHAKSVDLKPFDPARFRRATRKVSVS